MTLKPITEELAELGALQARDLAVRYEELFGRKPRVKHRQWLFRKCAWKIQEARFGGLTKLALARIDELVAGMDLPLGKPREPEVVRGELDRSPMLGTTLVRIWRGRRIQATRVENGWEHDGVVHKSLSAVAGHVTGSHCSGRAWFGLAKRVRK